MSTAQMVPETRPADIGPEEEFDHAICECSPDLAVCGVDVASSDEISEAQVERLCPLCLLTLEAFWQCSRCGR